ncbi:MAG: hypothetical protein JXA20_07205 [Spirochaetes bacterium]|nr:hypothetical protein [Spirochaetota bacterium]
MGRIFVVTGAIGSGKTTGLMEWAARQDRVDGILQPVIGGKRYMYHIASSTQRRLELDEGAPDDGAIRIGKYSFDRDVFRWGRARLERAFRDDVRWLVIDEVGPLELAGGGLEPALGRIIAGRRQFHGAIVLVIRKKLLDASIARYGLRNGYALMDPGPPGVPCGT